MRAKTFISILVLALAPPVVAAQSGIDAAKTMICAMSNVADCGVNDGCAQISPQTANLPRFLRVDIENKQIHGDGRSTAINSVNQVEDLVFLQGAAGERAWSMALSTTTGEVTGTVTGDGYGFVVFGACATLESLGS